MSTLYQKRDGKRKRAFSPEFKRNLVQTAKVNPEAAQQMAEENDLPTYYVNRWKKELENSPVHANSDKDTGVFLLIKKNGAILLTVRVL